MLELFDRVVINCEEVGLENEEISVRSTSYSFQNSGYRTAINGLHKGFSMAELLADHNRKLSGITGEQEDAYTSTWNESLYGC